MPLKISTALVAAAVLALTPATAALTATGASASASAKPNLRACYDGKCKLTLTRNVSFRVSPRFGITRLAISFNSGTVVVRGTGPGVTSQGSMSGGGSVTVNGIRVKVLSQSAARLKLSLTPPKR